MDDILGSFRGWVRGYAKTNWYLLVGLALLALVSISFSLLAPLPMKYLADYVFGSVPAPKYINGIAKGQLLVLVAIAYFGSRHTAKNIIGEIFHR